MRFEQIIATVTRSLAQQVIRAIESVDALMHASDLHLCMACVSPGPKSYLHPKPLRNLPCGHWDAKRTSPVISGSSRDC
jgi:hypothetical protein